jgi:hypothetical protein
VNPNGFHIRAPIIPSLPRSRVTITFSTSLTASTSVEHLYYDFVQVVNNVPKAARAHGPRAKADLASLGFQADLIEAGNGRHEHE